VCFSSVIPFAVFAGDGLKNIIAVQLIINPDIKTADVAMVWQFSECLRFLSI